MKDGPPTRKDNEMAKFDIDTKAISVLAWLSIWLARAVLAVTAATAVAGPVAGAGAAWGIAMALVVMLGFSEFYLFQVSRGRFPRRKGAPGWKDRTGGLQ